MKNIFFFFLGFFFSLNAQITLKGKITESSTGASVPEVMLFIIEKNQDFYSDANGNYSTSLPQGTYTLEIYADGYPDKSRKIVLDAHKTLNIKLSKKIVTTKDITREEKLKIQDIIITKRNKKIVNVKSPQMGVNNLDAETIKKIPAVLGEVDVVKSLTLLPGVSTSGEASGGFNVRGGGEDQNQVLQDNANLYNTTHLFGFFSVFHPDAIKDLNLYKGSIPSRFGGRIASVLDISLRKGSNKEFEIRGGIGSVSSRLTVEGPIKKDKSSFLIAGRGSYAHLFMTAAGEQNSARFVDLTARSDFKLSDKDDLSTTVYLSKDNFEIAGSFKNTYGNLLASINWKHKFNSILTSNTHLSGTNYFYGMNINLIGLDWKTNLKNLKFNYDLTHKVNNKLTLDYGLNSTYYQFNPGTIKAYGKSVVKNSQIPYKQAIENAIYINGEHELFENLTVQYGLRYSHYARLGKQSIRNYIDGAVGFNGIVYIPGKYDGSIEYKKNEIMKIYEGVEPRLAFSYLINKNNSIKASYTKTTQYIHLISNTSSATPLDIWAPSGVFIEPQRGDQISLGYFSKIDGGRYSIELESYYKRTKNRLDYVDGASLIAEQYIEEGLLPVKARSYGVELLLRKNKGDLTGWLSYTLSKAEQKSSKLFKGDKGINDGEYYNSSQDRTHDFSATLMYQWNKQWSFASNFIYQTGRPLSLANSTYTFEDLPITNFGKRNDGRLPAYHRFDVSATYVPPRKKPTKWFKIKNYEKEWVFSIYNIYNRHNYNSIAFKQNIESQKSEIIGTYIFGIIPSITFNFNF